MNLGFFKDLQNSFRDIDVNKFIEELSNYLKELNCKNEQLGILEQVQKENNISMISQNKMRNKQNEILKSYANETIDKGAMYFISGKSKTDDTYIVFKYEDSKESTIKLEGEKLPIGAGIDSILREKNGKYILDRSETEYVKNEVVKMVEEILKNQNEKLEKYRKEGHLYMVEEDINERIFLKDLDSKSNHVIEEVDFPKELVTEATEGTVFKYENGEYSFYSRDGFERNVNK